MSQWARHNPERMEGIASLPLDEQADALAEAAGLNSPWPRCFGKYETREQAERAFAFQQGPGWYIVDYDEGGHGLYLDGRAK